MGYWRAGVLGDWSDGVMEKMGWNLPVLQYSITPFFYGHFLSLCNECSQVNHARCEGTYLSRRSGATASGCPDVSES